MGPFNAEGHSLTVDTLNGGALVVKAFEVSTVAVEGVPGKGADAGGQGGEAALVVATTLPMLVVDRTDLASFVRKKQWADIAPNLMWHQTVTVLLNFALEGHGQTCFTEGETVRAEGFFVIGSVRPGHSSKATRQGEILVDIPSVEGAVQCAEFGFVSEVLFCVRHEGMKITLVGMVKGLGQFCEGDFAPAIDLGSDNA